MKDSQSFCQWCDVGSMKDLFDRGYFEEHMRINHFRNHYEVYY